MQKPSKQTVVGLTCLAAGAGLAVAGVAILGPVCYAWGRMKARETYDRSRDKLLAGVEDASERVRDIAQKAEGPVGEALKAARHTTVLAAGVVETAAHYVREKLEPIQ